MVEVEVDDNLSISIKKSNGKYYTEILYNNELVTFVNSNKKPWTDFTKARIRNKIYRELDDYNSRSEIDSSLETAFIENRDEIEEAFGWP